MRRTWRIAWRTAVAVLLLLTVLAVWLLFFFPNGLAVRVAESQAQKFGVSLSIGRLELQPLAGVTVEKLAIDVPANAGMKAPLIAVDKVHVDWSVRDAFHRHAHVTLVAIDGPHVHLEQRGPDWNWKRAMDAFVPPAAASPTPGATPAPPLEQQLRTQTEQLQQMLATLPADVDVDEIDVSGAGADVVGSAGTIASVSGIATRSTLHLPRGGTQARMSFDTLAQPGIAVALHPSKDVGFDATIHPDTSVAIDLPASITFGENATLEHGRVVAAGYDLPVALHANAHGHVDLAAGDVEATLDDLALSGFFDATGALRAKALGTKSLHASWTSKVDGTKLPPELASTITSSLPKDAHVAAGGRLTGSLDGRLDSSDPAALMATFARGRFPLTLAIESDGESADDPIAIAGLHVAKITHHASIHVDPAALTLDARATVDGLQGKAVVGGKRLDIALADSLRVPASLDSVDLGANTVDVPQLGLHVSGKGTIAGLKAALAAWQQAGKAKDASAMKQSLAAVTALSNLDLDGSLDFHSAHELEVVPGTFVKGAIHAKGSVLRGPAPFGRVKADVVYDGFGARIHSLSAPVATPAPKLASAGSSIPVATVSTADFLVLEGMDGHLTMDREVILGGHPGLKAEDIAADEAAVFDPATRGYYERLGSLRATTDNLHIDRIDTGPLRIRDLSAEVLYDGAAVHVNRARMELLGGEVVSRAILRPTAAGIHVVAAADCSGIDMSPFLLDHPVADPNDTRVHLSSQASLFLSKDDPIGSLAAARARVDVTAAGSKVLDTLLAWLDPENKDPMYNWARSVNAKIVGLSRPVFSSVTDRGMYDVTIAFPALGLSKDVRRIPLAPLLRLKFTQDMLAQWMPPTDLLPLLAARGIDADGNVLLPPVHDDEAQR